MGDIQEPDRNTDDQAASRAEEATERAKQTGEEWAGKAQDAGTRAKHTGEEWAGKAKEAAGKATGDARLEGEGKADQAKGSLKKAGDKLKQAFRKS